MHARRDRSGWRVELPEVRHAEAADANGAVAFASGAEDGDGTDEPRLAERIAENLVLKRYRRPPVARPPFLRRSVIATEAADLMERFDVRASSTDTPTRKLSGGNVQKVLLAREMSNSPRVLVVASPTQGLDVGAVATVHQLLLEVAESGVGLLLVSEDLDEVMALCDRIAVIYEGRILATIDAAEAELTVIGQLMGGHLETRT